MEWQIVLLIIFGSLLVVLLSGIPVVLAFVIVNLVAVFFLWGPSGGMQLFFNMRASVAMWALLPVVFFILLGEVMAHSGMSSHAMDVVDIWLGRLPGRLGLVAIGSGAVLASLTGSSLGSGAVLMASLEPDMQRRGYASSMSVGPIMAAATLAVMIPPSASIILYASLARISVGKLLMTGIIPGLLMAALYATYIVTRCYFQPSLAPPYEVSPLPLSRKLKSTVRDIVPVIIIIFLVIGVIFLGIATPSEAAASGALGMIVLAAIYGRLNWKVLKLSFMSTLRVTTMLLAIMLGAFTFAQVLSFTGCTRGLLEWISGLPLSPIAIVVCLLLFAGLLGCFMEGLAIMVMIVPIYMPIISHLGLDPFWFIILLLITAEIGLASPPFGLIVFMVKGMMPPEVKIIEIYKAAFPFILCAVAAVSIIVAFPQIALWLPNLMR